MLPTIIKPEGRTPTLIKPSQLPSPSASYKQAAMLSPNNKTNNKQTNNTSMLPLPSPNSNLATNKSSYQGHITQNTGTTTLTNGSSCDTMTRWVKMRRHSSKRQRPLSDFFSLLTSNNLVWTDAE